MSCTKSLSISPATTGETPMDDACYASTDGLIIGVSGSRVYKCSATDGSIITSSDYQQLGLSPASICYDVGTGRCFAVCWNTPSFDTSNSVGVRQITRIIPSNVTPDLTFDLATTFGLGFTVATFMQNGMGYLKSLGGNIYGMGSLTVANQTNVFKFQASAPGTNEHHGVGPEYASFALAVIGGNQRMYWNQVADQAVEWWDFVANTNGGGGVDTRNRLAIEYAPNQGNFYCTEEFQFIDIYDNTGTYLGIQLDTQRSAFNGVSIMRNPFSGLLYVAGGTDNSVAVIDPASNAFVHTTPGSRVQLGFDLPFRFVFTPTKTFAVQRGSVGLKEVV